ncbi:MAG: phosphatase PAP2 family protein [Planctomycetaceae bacterium]|nr:phosphatase PAP2 family protein [Planctomycetaceae bacterium]
MPSLAGTAPVHYLDVNGDDWISPIDALIVINAIEENLQPLAVAASLSPSSDPDGNGVVLLPQVTVVGQTLPGASVRIEVEAAVAPASSGLGETGLQKADAAGRFQFTVNLSPGLNNVRVEARNVLGESLAVEREVRRGDVILDWNASLLGVIRDWTTTSNDPYPNRIVTERPPVAARNLAMVHAAMYDAINSIENTHQPYHVHIAAPTGASPIAAAAAAAHRVASQLYREPDELAIFNAALSEALATVADGSAKSMGISLGEQVGDAILALRSADGASAEVTYTPGTDPGDWNRTFPGFLPPLITQWPGVAPFAMTIGSQFRPSPPPALNSAEYAAAVDEVMQLGRFDSPTRTVEQTEIAIFWADGGGTFTPPGHWNQIAADVALARGNSLSENARLFALLNIAEADAGIAAWDAKYAYDLWRPIDAIRRAQTDGNNATIADLTWTPLIVTPPFPTYTSGHSTFSGAADAVLSSFFGANTHFTTQSDGHSGFTQRPLSTNQIVMRSYSSFSEAADEAGRSRIYGGIHFEFDNTAGLAAGRAIGEFVSSEFLKLRAN